jgi:hypothetical protein
MKLSEKNLERIYFGIIFLFVLSSLIYKYITYGCVVMCGDWYD